MRNLFVILTMLATAATGRAQIGIYGTLSGVRVSNPASTQSNAYGGTNTGYWTTGGGIGAYYDLLHLGPISLGPDIRYTGASGAKMGLIGVRLAVHPRILPIKPYLEALGGIENTSNIYNNKSSDFAYEIAGGVDYTILPHVDFRAIEIGGGQIAGGISTAATGTRSLFTLSTGLAIRF